jgi:hypothetical protein
MAEDNRDTRRNKYAESHSTEKFGEGMALKI